ncbi:hypothetical protein IWX90DRAFT_484516 [Phyllosticta citrichinensis]|uniref:Uncharacterized protein n=1 Tax=Phyllosticta citrichinensis TaxID=1130410 RepID=A0ABR1XZ43_9PEZI
MGGFSQSVSSSRRGSTTACNTVAGGNNSVFAESVFQTPPLKRLRADSYFSQHGPLSENVSPRDTTPPPLAFPKPPPSKASQPPPPLCRSPVSRAPGQALSSPETSYNSGGNVAAALALNPPAPLNISTNDIAPPRGRHSNYNNNNNAVSDVFDGASSATTSLRACPPSTTAPGAGSRNTSRSRSRSSFRSHHPHHYGFHYPHLPHLPPVNSGADNRVGHMAGMVGPGPLSD